MQGIEQAINGTLDAQGASMFKAYLQELSDLLQRKSSDIARKVSRHCAENTIGEIVDFSSDLHDTIEKWRTNQA